MHGSACQDYIRNCLSSATFQWHRVTEGGSSLVVTFPTELGVNDVSINCFGVVSE